MSIRFPAVTDKDVIRVLRKIGFRFYQQAKGSHEVWRRESDGRHTIVPRHRGKIIKRRTLKSIIKDIGLSVGEFVSIKGNIQR
ncbi:type II toxin-antitoxin system HicA family toxin [candidate division WOR-3 bacterium]|nr:type II toxin-antitoxin system HicA family toxin [candidate division WOR-3 bacterium]